MKKTAIINYANTDFYKRGQDRLKNSIERFAPEIDFFGFDETSFEMPTHQENPYAFKGYCIEKVLELDYKKIIWADSPIVLTKPIDKLIEHLEKKHYFFFENIGFPLWEWISDKQLKEVAHHYNLSETLTRGYLKKNEIKQIMACFFGINTNDLLADRFIKDYIWYCKQPNFFLESWKNENNEVSSNENVKGGRHDQSLASLLIDIFKMKILKGQDTFFAYAEHYESMPISDSVCVNSVGII
jgi:hypothetical protein